MHQIGSLDNEAELLQLHFQQMLVAWGSNQPPRNGLHASSLLVSDNEWCTRRYVLADLFPDEAITPALQPWDWKRQDIFLHGWELHRKWQHLFLKFGRVVYSHLLNGQVDMLAPASPELDLIHFDTERNLYFSPDAILDFGPDRYVVEMKGVKQEAYLDLTNDLQTAMDCCETVHKAFYQCQLYMHLLSLSRGIILVENKNNQDFKLWVIQYDKKTVLENIHRAYHVKGCTSLVKSQGLFLLPARCCSHKSDARARQCPMAAKCFSEGLEG